MSEPKPGGPNEPFTKKTTKGKKVNTQSQGELILNYLKNQQYLHSQGKLQKKHS